MGKRAIVRSALLGVALIGSTMAGTARGAVRSGPSASLILAGWYGTTIPTPGFIRSNLAFLEAQPFQGVVAYLKDDATGANATSGVMGGSAIPVGTLTGIVAPLKGLPFHNLVDNFGLVQGSTPPDFFDDWTNVVANFGNLAAILKDAGLRGVCFDNEQYAAPWGNYPAGARYPAKTLLQYQDQARLRGSQVMQAMVASFPDIAVITLHGPYISELKAPVSLQFPQWQSGNNLLGPFFAGFVDGAGSTGVPVDGGELYTLRSDADFINSYNWRKFTLASTAIDCPFIPPALRTVWPDRTSISFGVYDRPFSGAGMDPATLGTTLTNALRHADRYVWFYTEGPTFLLPASAGGASAAWVDAVRQALGTVPAPIAPPAPTNLVAQPTSASNVSLSWSASGAGLTGLEIQRKTSPAGTYTSVAQVAPSVLQYTDTSLDANTTYVYRVRATTSATMSAFSLESSATTAAPSTPTESPAGNPGGTPAASGGSSGSCGLLGIEAVAFFGAAFAWRRRRAG